ncbi:MAG TPA: diguanylate cyclase [Gammaproteobacteria bacterium]|nr:diguanylate cyclase [Gammaproteobacteria bacterium]
MFQRPRKQRDARGKARWAGLALACLACGMAAAAADTPFPPGSSLRFRHIGIEDGLAQSSVQAIIQDSQGYMWFGTQDGLQRYDGYEFLTLRHDPADPDSLADNNVNVLALGEGGALWVGTTLSGLDRLEPGTRRFTHFHHDPKDPASIADDQISSLLVDRKHRMWIGHAAGLDRFDGHVFHHYRLPSKTADGVLSLYEDAGGRLWVGSNHGVFYFDDAGDRLQSLVPPGIRDANERGLFTESPIHGFMEAGGFLLIASGRGIAALDADHNEKHFYSHGAATDSLSNDHALALLKDPTGDVWVGTYGGGLNRFEVESGRFESYQHDATDPGSLGSDNIDMLYQDRSGLVWIGTNERGVDVYNPRTRAFGYYRHRQGDANSLASNMVWSVYKDAHDELWVGTDQGLTRLDASRRRYRQYHMGNRPANRPDDDQINAVTGDGQGGIWAGTDYGLFRRTAGSEEFRHYDLIAHDDGSEGDIVNLVYVDGRGRVWAGTGLGLVRVEPATGKVWRYQHDDRRPGSLPDNSVVAMCETGDGKLWLGTGGGLAYFDGEHDLFTAYHSDPRDPASLSYDSIQSCQPDGEGGLWIGTAVGLDHLKAGGHEFKRYFAADGLPSDTIYAVLRDGSGGIWSSTGHGLSRLDPATGTFRNYVKSDGLQSDEFNGGAAFAAPDGELLFGGVDGINAFYPEQLSRDTEPPAVAITRFVRHGDDVSLDTPGGPLRQVEVQYRQNILSFEFTAFDYAEPELNIFSYRLDGFDSDWHTLRGRHAATYTNLDPGSYVLRVRGANSDGVWNEREAVLDIEVLPPAWRTGWAYLLYVAAAFVALMLGLGLYKRFITREHQLENEQQRRQWAESLHNLIHSVTAQRDERAIAEQLIDTLTNFITYEQALFYVERDGMLQLVASRGIGSGEQDYLEHWPQQQPRIVARLRQASQALLLASEDAATLAGGGARPGRHHYLAVPLHSGSGAFRLLLVGRPNRPLDLQQMEVASAMAKQVSVALDNAQLIKDLENLATTDGLTRLYNRRHFMERAESEFERSHRYRRELSVFLIDADHFKAINDTHGHDAGDRVLRLLAATCRQGLRQLDVLGRYGGEELVVLLPETPAGLALETAERLRRSIEQLRVPALDGEIHLSVSIGVATATSDTESVAALINQADRALYEAKRGGRNRVVAAGGKT